MTLGDLSCRAGTALSLDLMRRLPTAPNGVNERMIVDTIGWAHHRHMDVVSLNFAAFRGLLDEATDRSATQTVGVWLVHRLEGHFGIQMDTLRRFNAKFHPTWTPPLPDLPLPRRPARHRPGRAQRRRLPAF
jgi:lysyl-tRNA synthetase class 2